MKQMSRISSKPKHNPWGAFKVTAAKALEPNASKKPNLTREQLTKLALVPHYSLEMIENGVGSATDWYNLSFRITTAYLTAQMFYSPETVAEFYRGVEICEIKRKQAQKNLDVCVCVSKDQIQILAACLAGMDQIQEELNYPEYRAQLIFVFKETLQYLEKYLPKT